MSGGPGIFTSADSLEPHCPRRRHLLRMGRRATHGQDGNGCPRELSLVGALVKRTRLERDDAPIEERRTDSSGRASFSLTRNRNRLLNVVWIQPVTGPSEVDFDTIFSSLTFGFP